LPAQAAHEERIQGLAAWQSWAPAEMVDGTGDDMTSDAFGKRGEENVAMVLYQSGRKVKRMSRRSPFDLLIDDTWRVEVKVAGMRMCEGAPLWSFNLHRHGKLNEKNVDWYILRLEDIPFCKYAIHLLLRAPAKQLVVSITLRSLLNGQAELATKFQKFADGKIKRRIRP
jgi:hypothetical protein